MSAVVVILVVVLVGGGGDGGGENVGGSVLPDGGSVPEQKVTDLDAAAKAAGCELKSFKGTSREHTDDLAEQIQYNSNPPTSGKHYADARRGRRLRRGAGRRRSSCTRWSTAA